MSNPLVSIVMGSDSDLEVMNEAAKALDQFGIAYEIDIASATARRGASASFRGRRPDAASRSSLRERAGRHIWPG